MTVQRKTIYERVHFVYCRDAERFLNCRKQKSAVLSEDEAWDALKISKAGSSDLHGLDMSERCSNELRFFEQPRGDVFIGLATEVFDASVFDLWFLNTMISNGEAAFECNKPAKGEDFAVQVTEIFEESVKNAAIVDRWEEGRDAFINNVRFFTSRRIPIEAVLPAFPCKSSNRDKAARGEPDLGEELAVRRIMKFVQLVNAIYPPGMKFFIVSDGHVFSDCINVDDDVVDRYTEQLMEVYEKFRPDGFDGIHFRGLNDCFKSSAKSLVMPFLEEVPIDHHLDTVIDDETDINRKVLMLGCDDNADLLREQIRTPGHSRLYLYRGFNKFMSEDLIGTAKAKELSGKKYKKLVSNVSYEMIRRNDAYSNLVELVFPFHLRLSIHAHHNAGPKYGIRLLDPELCSTGAHDQSEEDKLLHIPTPWHNSIFKIEGHKKLVVSPASLAREYEDNEDYEGGWDEKAKCFVFNLKSKC